MGSSIAHVCQRCCRHMDICLRHRIGRIPRRCRCTRCSLRNDHRDRILGVYRFEPRSGFSGVPIALRYLKEHGDGMRTKAIRQPCDGESTQEPRPGNHPNSKHIYTPSRVLHIESRMFVVLSRSLWVGWTGLGKATPGGEQARIWSHRPKSVGGWESAGHYQDCVQ
jgi:hypothetical protein